MYNERNIEKYSICYTTTTYEVHTFKNKNKRKLLRDMFCLSFSLLYLFIPSCRFAITEAGTYNIAHDENMKTATGVL